MLHLHRSERADALVVPLAQSLATPPEDPFTPDVVAVPTRGVERWLAQRLSHHLGTGDGDQAGVCANVTFESPARLVGDVLATVLGLAPEDDPWQRDRLTWHLLEVIDACAAEPWCAPLGRFLGAERAPDAPGDGTQGEQGDTRRGRRVQAAQHLAALFSSYAAQRPHMVRAWAGGRDADGTGGDVPEDLRWQPELWRRLRSRLGTASPAERLEDAVGLLRDRPDAVALPARLSVFGPTRLPVAQVQVLHALAQHREVHLWLPHPSPALWDAVTAQPPTLATGPDDGAPPRRHVTTPVTHPVLASMARDATELQLRLAGLPGTTSTHHPADAPPGTLLGGLQRRLRDDTPDAAPDPLGPADRSVQVHACHGRARQVEVLREALIGLFADDPTLEPRDVIVMCPDVEAFAPLVAATFGLAPGDDEQREVHPGRSLRVRLADRSLRQTNPLLSLLSTLLELADGRVTASQVVDLAGTEPVRRRFRLDEDDVDRIREWATEAGAHWGEDAGRRARFGLDVVQGTWATALDRILLGAAMAEEDHRYVGSALPLDDVDSTDVDLAGRLAELVDRLTVVLAELDGSRPVDGWLDTLHRALDLLAGTTPADSWQDVEARTVLDETRRQAAEQAGTDLRLSDVRALLARALRGRPTRAGFRTGALTICSLEPMRAVPHRVVALLGMDDGAFPRGSGTDGDDVLLREPLVGERDRRGEDRQLFLDAVSAAQDHLLVLFSGADERTGAGRPPAVPVGELLDALDTTATSPDDAPVRSHVLVRHPLQTVDERNFTAGALGRSGPFSFDAVNHRAAVVGRGERVEHPPFLTAPLPPLRPEADQHGLDGTDDADVTLDELIRTLEHPVRAFLRRRLGVLLPSEVDQLEDRLPIELDGLTRWGIGDRVLAAALDGVDLDQAVNAEWRRGQVPPRGLGRAVLEEVRQQVHPIAETTRQHLTVQAATVDVVVPLPGGRLLTGTVPGVRGSTLVRAVFSRLAAKHRLRAWVQLLALTAAQPDQQSGQPPAPPYRAMTIGRPQGRQATAAVARLSPPHPDDARRWLANLVDLRDQALREPLPMPINTACAYARSRNAGDEEVQALDSARREWKAGFEQSDEQHRLVWGDDVALGDLLGAPPTAEQVWWPDDRTRFGVLARRLWEPLLEHEETETV